MIPRVPTILFAYDGYMSPPLSLATANEYAAAKQAGFHVGLVDINRPERSRLPDMGGIAIMRGAPAADHTYLENALRINREFALTTITSTEARKFIAGFNSRLGSFAKKATASGILLPTATIFMFRGDLVGWRDPLFHDSGEIEWPMDRFTGAVRNLPIPFLAADIAQTPDGQWTLIGIQDGQVAALDPVGIPDAALFYGRMRSSFPALVT